MLNWSKIEPLFTAFPYKMCPSPEYNISDPVKTRLEDYLLRPSPEQFLSLCDAVAQSPNYSPYADYGASVNPLIEKGDFEKAKNLIMTMMPGFLANPGIHLFAAHALRKLGRDENANFEGFLATMCVRGILSTGDGSKQRPYSVLSVTDEYDVLRYLKKRPQSQALVDNDGKHCDLFEFPDGSQLWFDITIPFMHQAKQFPQR